MAQYAIHNNALQRCQKKMFTLKYVTHWSMGALLCIDKENRKIVPYAVVDIDMQTPQGIFAGEKQK